jgi:hypothetical protein
VSHGRLIPVERVAAADTRKRHVRATTLAQAQALAEAEQARHEIDKTSLEVQLPGDTRLVAGATVDVTGWSRIDGRYLIITARHEISRSSGYTTMLLLKRIKERA